MPRWIFICVHDLDCASGYELGDVWAEETCWHTLTFALFVKQHFLKGETQ
jgi:hypothetical protein